MNTKTYQKSRKALADNLNELIGGKGLSVNGEAQRRKIPQRSLENLTNLDVDPRLSTIAAVAHAFGLEPWQALLPHTETETRKRSMDWLRLWNSATAPTRRVMEMALRLALEEEQAEQKGATGRRGRSRAWRATPGGPTHKVNCESSRSCSS